LSPEAGHKHNLAEYSYDMLKQSYDNLLQNLNSTMKYGHHVITGTPPSGITLHISNHEHPRLLITGIRHSTNGTVASIQATAVVLFFKPRMCCTLRNDGQKCPLRHRTAQEFCLYHPEYDPVNVHISHLCHFAECVNPTHLLLEPATINLKRSCRRECECGATPK